MDALDLTIEDAVRVNRFAVGPPELIGKPRFRLALGPAKGVAKRVVVGEGLQFPQQAEVCPPAIPDGLGDRIRKRRDSARRVAGVYSAVSARKMGLPLSGSTMG
jgi:hypothetical protein